MRARGFLIVLVLLSQCEDDRVRFEVPQPEGQKNESAIPRKMFGVYVSLNDSSLLVITPRCIVRKAEENETILLSKFLSDVDSVDRYKFTHDTTFSKTDTVGCAFINVGCAIRGDQVFQKATITDTLFGSHHDVVRKFKGYYFLNHRISEKSWSVRKAGITRQGIAIGEIASVEDINTLRALTNSESDTVYTFRPTRKQMKKYLKENGFGREERFVKIKDSTFD
jgi:hypothetical protein